MRRIVWPEMCSRLLMLLLLVGASLVSGCGSLPQLGKPGAAGSASGGTAKPEPATPQAEQQYFAGQDDLKVYEQASTRSRLVGQLTLHQKVLRSAVSNGYARIRTPDGQLQGWVDNARLIWRLPGSEAPVVPAPAEEQPPAGTGEPPAIEAPQAEGGAAPDTRQDSVVPVDAAVPVPPDREAAAEPAVPQAGDVPAKPPPTVNTPQQGTEKPAPSVFNPF